jgi:hypothetical protein
MSIDFRADAGKARPLIPGAYERNTLTYPEPGSSSGSGSVALPVDSSTMDAATIADRQWEGGGAPSQRRRKVRMQAGIGPAPGGTQGNNSWLRGGYLWFQKLRLAHR